MEKKIIVIYRADGSVERYPINLPGGLCRLATKPYQDLDARHGNVTDTATNGALLPETTETQIDLKG
jgi:hypothetical protein